MEILEILGLNQTLVAQFIIFFIAYMTLSRLVFMPYLRVYQQRKEATDGNQKNAEVLLQEVDILQQMYSKEARALNAEIKSHFDKAKMSAHSVVSEKVSQVRKKVEAEIKGNRKNLESIRVKLKSDIDADLPEMSSMVIHQLLKKDIS